MANFQARIKPQWRHKYPHLKEWKWYDVVPLWPRSKDRMLDMAGKRVARLDTGEEHTMIRAEYINIRPHQPDVAQSA